MRKERTDIEAQASESVAPKQPALLVKLDVFDGPLDLLLQLVLQQDVDITHVSLASVCEQYLAYLALMDALDIELASDYLVIAATLIFIKSKKLLPPPPPPFDQDMPDDAAIAEEELRRRLIAYRHFKDAGAGLRERMEIAAAYYPRQNDEAVLDGLVQRYALDAATLAAAFKRALENAEARPAVLKRETFSVVVKMNHTLRLIRERASMTFSELIAGCSSLEIVVTFLAVLELIRARKIRFVQTALFDDIVFTPQAKGATDDLAQSA